LIAFEAAKAGALEVMPKPLDQGHLVTTVRNHLAAITGSNTGEHAREAMTSEIRPVAIRWARFILKACTADEDPRRVPDFATAACTSEGVFDEICELCGVSSRDSKNIGRALRAIALARQRGTLVWVHLAINEKRTLDEFLTRAGVTRSTRHLELSEFFRNQKFIPTSKPCLRELAHMAANSPLFFS
jgi:hypothetical protein